MNNLTTTISFSIFSNKGVFALIIGSGVSRPSGIPTGWDIVIDLIKKLSVINNEDCFPEPEDWFRKKYHEEPDYSAIITKLVSTPSERVNFLRPYIEPSSDDREKGLKVPTKAHIAIAKMVKKGLIKLIITTNFDRLIETALQYEGIDPIVIRHSNDINGIMPLVHNDFTLIKVNGDYLDNRFLNTKKELAAYEKHMQDFLMRIFDEYGIISCGWSGKWDFGLINIIKRCKNFRFNSFWTFVGNCEKELEEIAKIRRGQTIKIIDADSFFTEILEKTEALESFEGNHPLNANIALVRLKNYIVKEENKIQLHDLLLSEQEDVYRKIRQIDDFSLYPNGENILPQLKKYESALEILLPLIINGVFWSKPEHNILFHNIISRISEPPTNFPGKFYEPTRDLHYYPSLLLFFSLGISSIKAKKYDLLTSCFQMKIAVNENEISGKLYLIQQINSWIIDPKIMNEILSTNYKTPISTFVNRIIRPYFKELIVNDQEYNDIFDIFEYLLGLNYLYFVNNQGIDWVPYGQYQWRSVRAFRKETFLLNEFLLEADTKKSDWEPLKSGMFGGDYPKFNELKARLDKFLTSFVF
jgi:hypothetical protein